MAVTDIERCLAVPLPVRQYGYRSWPGDIVELADGRLLMAYKASSSTGGTPLSAEQPERDLGIGARASADGGRTWGPESMLFADPPGGIYAHPGFLRLPGDQLLISYIYRADTTPYYGHNYYRRSGDDGATWSDQFVLTPRQGYVIVHNDKLRRLSDGRIVAPAEYKKDRPTSHDHSDYAALVFYSDSEGLSWQAADNDIDVRPHECQEPHIAELRDGRLLLLFRTYSGWVGRAFSADRGRTWSGGEPLPGMIMSKRASAVTVDRIPATGDLLLIRCTGEGGPEGRYRTPLVTAVSRDEGETWGCQRVLEGDPDDDFGYQSVTFLEEGGAP
ncbi:MAG: sialidase family protein, partial [Gemmatimonadota bacterium]